jgi:hypothetical protein
MEGEAMEKQKKQVSEEARQQANHVYYLYLLTLSEHLGITRDKFIRYKDERELLESLVIGGITNLQSRLKRCNRAYRMLQRENTMLKSIDLFDLIKAQRDLLSTEDSNENQFSDD